jgi:molecular chaperone GrpE
MNEMTDPMKPEPSEESQDLGPTIDLDAAELEEVKDLQAFADEVAESTPDSGEPEEDGIPNGNQEATLHNALKRIAELEKQEAEHKDKHHRLLADFANHRNRVGRETQLAVTLAEKKLLLELLPVVDNFERCLSSKVASVEDFHNGVELIYRQFQEALRKAGVEGVDVKVGDAFDAMHAEALTTTSQPELPDGAVAAVFERGYRLRDQLLRPARVIVNHSPLPQEPPEAGGTVQ